MPGSRSSKGFSVDNHYSSGIMAKVVKFLIPGFIIKTYRQLELSLPGMTKRFILITVLITLTAITGGYLLMDGGADNPSPRSKTGDILDKFGDLDNTSGDSQEPRIIALSSEKTVSPTNSADGEVVFYQKDTGKVFKIDLASLKETPVSDKILPNFLEAIWASNKKDVISLYSSPKGTQFKYYSPSTQKTTDFNPDTKSVAISPDGSMTAYFTFTPGTGEEVSSGHVFISEPDGNYSKKILDTRLESANLYWPLPEKISFQTPSTLFLLSKDGSLLKLVEVDSDSLNTKWSPDGKKALFSYVTANGNTELWLKNIETGSESPLSTNLSAKNCSWSIDNIHMVCSTEKRGSLVSDIYVLNTLDITKKLIATSLVGSSNIFLSSLEDYVIFTSPADDKLYGVRLFSN